MVLSKSRESTVLGNEVAPEPIPVDETLDHIPEGAYVDQPFVPGLHTSHKSKFRVLINKSISLTYGKEVIDSVELSGKIRQLSKDFATTTFEVYTGSKDLVFCGTLEVDNKQVEHDAILKALELVKSLKEDHEFEYYKNWPLKNESGEIWAVIQVAYSFK